MSEKNILEEIAEKTRERIRKEKLQFPLDQLKTLAEKAPQQPSFLEALKKPGTSFRLWLTWHHLVSPAVPSGLCTFDSAACIS